jgi:hypothetical protein
VENHVCLSHDVQVGGATWRASTRIVAGVGDLMQRTEDGRIGQVLGGQLLHMDTVGPSQVRSMGGKWYVLIIVDDYSRYSWVSFWKARMRCLSTFGA